MRRATAWHAVICAAQILLQAACPSKPPKRGNKAMDQREKIVRDLLGRLTARQFDSIGELIADDAVFDVPYAAPNDALPAMGRAAFLHMFVDVTANLFNPFELSAVAFYHSEDPTVTVVEYASKGIFSPTGRPMPTATSAFSASAMARSRC